MQHYHYGSSTLFFGGDGRCLGFQAVSFQGLFLLVRSCFLFWEVSGLWFFFFVDCLTDFAVGQLRS